MNAVVEAAGFSPDKLRDLDPPPTDASGTGDQPAPKSDMGDRPQKDNQSQPTGKQSGRVQQYSIEQAASDNAQLHTIAFNGLAFLTGDFGADTFLPPGKVCDFSGFQYMRDIDCLLYTSPSPRDGLLSRMPSSA